MTSPTPLTPANEPTGTDPAPLTDEELAEAGMAVHLYGKHHYACAEYAWLVGSPSVRAEHDACPPCDCGLRAAHDQQRRLIADLRAARAEVERLRGEREPLVALALTAQREQWRLAVELRADASLRWQERAAEAEAEVERLRAYDHAAHFPTLVVPDGGVHVAGPLTEPLLLVTSHPSPRPFDRTDSPEPSPSVPVCPPKAL